MCSFHLEITPKPSHFSVYYHIKPSKAANPHSWETEARHFFWRKMSKILTGRRSKLLAITFLSVTNWLNPDWCTTCAEGCCKWVSASCAYMHHIEPEERKICQTKPLKCLNCLTQMLIIIIITSDEQIMTMYDTPSALDWCHLFL